MGPHVALKILPFQRLVRESQLERFRREARAAARLHHSNIVPVFGVGECDGVHYYAMQYIQGQSLFQVWGFFGDSSSQCHSQSSGSSGRGSGSH